MHGRVRDNLQVKQRRRQRMQKYKGSNEAARDGPLYRMCTCMQVRCGHALAMSTSGENG